MATYNTSNPIKIKTGDIDSYSFSNPLNFSTGSGEFAKIVVYSVTTAGTVNVQLDGVVVYEQVANNSQNISYEILVPPSTTVTASIAISSSLVLSYVIYENTI